MAAENRKKVVDDQYLISKFMNHVLDHEDFPSTVYSFCKSSKIKEEEFYKYFGSIDSIKKGVWIAFFNNTLEVMNKNSEYSGFSSKDKMLTFFYTFFELLTMNRSYVLFSLQQSGSPLNNLKMFRGLRKNIKDFSSELIQADNEDKAFKITKNPVSVFSEGAWIQFLFILKFWMDDDSAGFEKTDMAIEKSVNTIFDLFDNTPLTNVLDFGKFVWKEKWMWN